MDGSSGSSFWTVCRCCSLQYEYPSFYEDMMVLCAHCRQPFRATKHPTPSMAHVSPKLERQINREKGSKVSIWGFSPAVSKVEVKIQPKAEVKTEPMKEVKVEEPTLRDSGNVNQLGSVSRGESKQKSKKIRKTRNDKGVRRNKFALSPYVVRSALLEKSKSIIKVFTGQR